MSLKSFTHSILSFVAHLWENLKPEFKKYVHIGVDVAQKIKDFDTANPMVADILASFIPNGVGQEIEAKLRAALPVIIDKLKLIDGNNLSTQDATKFILDNIEALNKLTGLDKKIKMDNLAKLITDVVADGKLDWKDLAYVTKYYYDNEYKNTVASPVK